MDDGDEVWWACCHSDERGAMCACAATLDERRAVWWACCHCEKRGATVVSVVHLWYAWCNCGVRGVTVVSGAAVDVCTRGPGSFAQQ